MEILRKPVFNIFLLALLLIAAGTLANPVKKPAPKLPYKQAGLSKEEAAAHLLGRFSFGPTPGQAAEIANLGLENWLMTQLYETPTDAVLDKRIAELRFLQLSEKEVVDTFPNNGLVRRKMIAQGLLPKAGDSIPGLDERKAVEDYMKANNLYPRNWLLRQLIEQKILRAVYHPHQLQEVLVHFWYNHFNISVEKDQAGLFVPSFENKVIRPNTLGKFEDLLLATAQSPAMLQYLDNTRSAVRLMDAEDDQLNPQQRRLRTMAKMDLPDSVMKRRQVALTNQGLNENYARELMELHTLGVDGGYTQQDVTEAAKILTGWSIYPMGDGAANLRKQLENANGETMASKGFVVRESFLFAANRHDRSAKTVLGQHFEAGGGYEEGIRLLQLLANHPSTARFISTKLAIRFVSDQPPKKLIDKMAATFQKTGGDIREVILAMVQSPEFWRKEALREKTKSPFELAISTLRATDAKVGQTWPLYNWITRMGEKFYAYQAPTGFPDKGSYWINTGSLLNRMNFGLAYSAGRIPGIRYNLDGLLQQWEPESPEAALETFFNLLMPARNATETIARLTPVIREPGFHEKIQTALQQTGQRQSETRLNEERASPAMENTEPTMMDVMAEPRRARREAIPKPQAANTNNPALAQVLGVLLGSPEFQRK